MADVQIDANDLINAFTTEAGDLLKRAIIAESKFKAAAGEVGRLRGQVADLQQALTELQQQLTPVEEILAEPEEPKRATRRR